MSRCRTDGRIDDGSAAHRAPPPPDPCRGRHYGTAWGWPPVTMTREADRADLQRHAGKPGGDAEVPWWVRDEYVGSPVEEALDRFVPQWLAAEWPLTAPRYVGRDISWDDWLALPDLH